MKNNKTIIRVSYGPVPDNRQRWKATNAGWPEPNDWIKRLCKGLEDRYEVYEQEPDVLLRRNKAAAMLGQVLSSLHELPPFHSGHAHMPLKDLLIFLNDLDRGRSPPWAKPVNFGGTSATTTAETELREWVNGVVWVLWSTGMMKTESYKVVAKGLSAHGRKGKDGGAVPWRSVQQWCRNLGHPKDTMIGRRIMDRWQVMPCTHGFLVTNCIESNLYHGNCRDAQSIASSFANGIWDLPHLRDRF